MDVTLRHTRPREIPISKPSAEQQYIPRLLTRSTEKDDSRMTGKPRWMPNESTPGASKHWNAADGDGPLNRTRLAPPETVSELDVGRLHQLDDEITHLEDELHRFVDDFQVAMAAFSAQAASQKILIKSLVKAPVDRTPKPSKP